jgi:hypothetical protein
MMLISLGINLAAAVQIEDLISAVGHPFHHYLTYLNLHVTRRITENHDMELLSRGGVRECSQDARRGPIS